MSIRGDLAESKVKNLNTRTEKLNFEFTINNGLGLSNKLIQSLFGDGSVASTIDVSS